MDPLNVNNRELETDRLNVNNMPVETIPMDNNEINIERNNTTLTLNNMGTNNNESNQPHVSLFNRIHTANNSLADRKLDVDPEDQKELDKTITELKKRVMLEERGRLQGGGEIEYFELGITFKTYQINRRGDGNPIKGDLQAILSADTHAKELFEKIERIAYKIWGAPRKYDFDAGRKSHANAPVGFRRNGNEAINKMVNRSYKDSALYSLKKFDTLPLTPEQQRGKKPEAYRRIRVIQTLIREYDTLIHSQLEKERENLKRLEDGLKERNKKKEIRNANEEIKRAEKEIEKINKNFLKDEDRSQKLEKIREQEEKIKEHKEIAQKQYKEINNTRKRIQELQDLKVDRSTLFLTVALTDSEDIKDPNKVLDASNLIQKEVQNCINDERELLIKLKQDVPEDKVYSIEAGGLVSSALKVTDGRSAYIDYIQNQSLNKQSAKQTREGLQEELIQFAYGHIDYISNETVDQIVGTLKSIYGHLSDDERIRDNELKKMEITIKNSLLTKENNQVIAQKEALNIRGNINLPINDISNEPPLVGVLFPWVMPTLQTNPEIIPPLPQLPSNNQEPPRDIPSTQDSNMPRQGENLSENEDQDSDSESEVEEQNNTQQPPPIPIRIMPLTHGTNIPGQRSNFDQE